MTPSGKGYVCLTLLAHIMIKGVRHHLVHQIKAAGPSVFWLLVLVEPLSELTD